MKRLLPLLLAAALVACHGPAGGVPTQAAAAQTELPSGVVLLDASVRKALKAPDGDLPPLSGLPGRPPITTCEALLAQLKAGLDLGEQREQPGFSAWSDCLIKGVIAGAHPSAHNPFDLKNAGRQILTQLDLASVRSSLAQRRPAEHYRLSDFHFTSTRVEPLSVEVVSDTFRYGVVVLAAGDFRGTGSASLLVQFSERALAGSYESRTLLILDKVANDDAIVATDALDHLRTSGRRGR